MVDCAQCPVREQAICRSLSLEETERLAGQGRKQRLERGAVLQWEDEESLLVGNVIEGVLKLSSSTSEGREQTFGLARPGAFVGRPFGRRATHSVTALSDALVCIFRRSDFDSFARGHTELEHELLERTLADLDHTRKWMMLLGRMKASQKVATFLLEMAPGEEEGAVQFELPCSRQGIADILGLTIETVSRQMTELRNAGIIETPGHRGVLIVDRDTLEAVAEAD